MISFFWISGAVFPAIFIVGASYAGYDKVLVVALFTLAMGFLGKFLTKIASTWIGTNFSNYFRKFLSRIKS